MRRFLHALLLVAATTVGVAAVVAWKHSRGVHVTVTNRGPESLASVVVHVTGDAHTIGNLAAGESKTVRVRPTGKSHVEVEFVDPVGQKKRLNGGGYFEPGPYNGTIEIELETGAIKRNEHRIGLSYF